MPFHEKSAWIMSVALLLAGAGYFVAVALLSSGLGQLAPPTLPLVALYTVFLVIAAIVGHALIAIMAPRDAAAPYDERDRRIVDRAGHLSGYVFAAGVLVSLASYLFSYDGNLLFYAVFASLMMAQMTGYGVQIHLYRSAI